MTRLLFSAWILPQAESNSLEARRVSVCNTGSAAFIRWGLCASSSNANVGAGKVAVEPLPQYSAHFFTAFGKNNCSPPILYEAITPCPSALTIQSINFCPACAFTCGCFIGFTRITPY